MQQFEAPFGQDGGGGGSHAHHTEIHVNFGTKWLCLGGGGGGLHRQKSGAETAY